MGLGRCRHLGRARASFEDWDADTADGIRPAAKVAQREASTARRIGRLPIGRPRRRLFALSGPALAGETHEWRHRQKPEEQQRRHDDDDRRAGDAEHWLDVCDIASPVFCPRAATAAAVVVVLTGTFVVAVVPSTSRPFPAAPPPPTAPPDAAAPPPPPEPLPA